MLKYYATVVNTTITLGNTSQQIKPAGRNRTFIEIVNNSAEALWLNFGAAAAADTGIKIAAGATWRSPTNFCPTNSINIVGATTGSKFSYLVA